MRQGAAAQLRASNERNGFWGVNDFAAKAASVRWCVPPGSSIQVYGGRWAGPFTFLTGYGQVMEVPDLSAHTYPYATSVGGSPGGSVSGSIETFKFVENYTDPQGIAGVSDPTN